MTSSAPAVRPSPGRPYYDPRPLVEAVRQIGRYRSLLRFLVAASLRTESAGTFFGFLWWILDPLLQMAVFTLVFDVVLQRGTPNYPFFILCAIIPYIAASRAVRNSVALMLSRQSLMRQIAFPRIVIPLAGTIAEFIHLLFGVALYLVVAIAFGVHPSVATLFALVVLVVWFVWTLTMTLAFSTAAVYHRDVDKLIPHIFRAGLFVSPAIYAITQVPGRFRLLYELNPFAAILTGFRNTLFDHTLPDLALLGAVFGASLVLLLIAFVFFVRHESAFAKIA